MSETECFLTGKSDCELTDISVGGVTYYIDEDYADEHSLKALKKMIADKVAEAEAERLKEQEEAEKKKNEALGQLTAACETLGLSKEDLGRFLLGQEKPAEPEPVAAPPRQNNQSQPDDADYQEVEGGLTSKIRANVNYDEGVAGTATAFTGGVTNEDGQTVVETNKKVKRVGDNAIVSKGDFGQTTIAIDHRSGSQISQDLCRVDENHNLVRSAVSGGNGAQSRECPLCRGTGFTRATGKLCPKCEGTGFILI